MPEAQPSKIEEVRKIATNSNVQASAMLTVGALLWKWISYVSNVDFLLSINQQKFAMLFDFLESAGWIILTIFGAIWLIMSILHKEYHRPQNAPSWEFVLSSATIAFLFGVLLAVRSTGAVPAVIVSWGASPNVCSSIMDTTRLLGFRKDYRLALACGPVDPTTDKLEDQRITVSAPFTIVAGGLAINAPLRPAFAELLRENPQTPIWLDPILIPRDVPADRITKLSDLLQLKGIILRPQYFNQLP